MSVNSLTFEQVSTILNSLYQQATGRTALTSQTTGDFVSVAQATISAGNDAVMNAIGNVLGRTIFAIRPYNARFAGLEKGWDRWGAYMRKLSIADSDFADDAAYDYPVTYDANETVPSGDGGTVDQWTIKKPDVLQTYFMGSSVYGDHVSIMEDQLESAFRGPEELGSFLSLITTNLSNRLELSRDTLARGLVSNLIASLVSENQTGRVIHLLTEYNTLCGLTGDDELTDIRCDEAVRIQSRTLVGVIRHHSAQRTIRQVDKSVSRAQQQTGDQRISELAVQTELRRREGQYRQNSIWHRPEKQIRAKLAPTRVRSVGDDSDNRVHHSVPDRTHEHDHTCQRRTQTVNVGVENKQPKAHQVPHKVRRGVTKAVTQFFFNT